MKQLQINFLLNLSEGLIRFIFKRSVLLKLLVHLVAHVIEQVDNLLIIPFAFILLGLKP